MIVAVIKVDTAMISIKTCNSDVITATVTSVPQWPRRVTNKNTVMTVIRTMAVMGR